MIKAPGRTSGLWRLLQFGLANCIAWSLLGACAPFAQAQAPIDHEGLTQQIRPLVDAAIEAGDIPGCVVAVGGPKKIHYLMAFGDRQLQPTAEPMTVDTIFDMASLTKPVATATSVMRLIEDGKVHPDQTVAHYLPEFAQSEKAAVTVEQLLVHRSGLIADNAMADYRDGPDLAWQRIMALKLRHPAGTHFAYSDVGFLVLGRLVEQVSGQPLSEFARDNLFQPCGMSDTSFQPPADMIGRVAPTERRGDQWIRGQVHDPRAFALGGVAGHAGLFSTAQDLSRYAQMMLGQGSLGDQQVLAPKTVAMMTADHTESPQRRGLGWDKQSGYSSNRADNLSEDAFGHGGFTGTVVWIDPQQKLFYIVLSNRLHPDGQGSINRTAAKIGRAAIETFRSSDGSGTSTR